ncbi:prepilin-type N-terminal cleavage/methylation domain-containing protein [bacterium]|nr:prepilin-type N-terminal cleavage/methylation domain-containing protein [bacterium]
MKFSNSRYKGFTLIEVLMSVGIFLMIIMSIYRYQDQSLKMWSKETWLSQKDKEVQVAFRILKEDLQRASDGVKIIKDGRIVFKLPFTFPKGEILAQKGVIKPVFYYSICTPNRENTFTADTANLSGTWLGVICLLEGNKLRYIRTVNRSHPAYTTPSPPSTTDPVIPNYSGWAASFGGTSNQHAQMDSILVSEVSRVKISSVKCDNDQELISIKLVLNNVEAFHKANKGNILSAEVSSRICNGVQTF